MTPPPPAEVPDRRRFQADAPGGRPAAGGRVVGVGVGPARGRTPADRARPPARAHRGSGPRPPASAAHTARHRTTAEPVHRTTAEPVHRTAEETHP
ncbi:hypothetical protein [Streptomyces sp. NBC_01276]|uniref:hypothetical protein n=1 Tax=Streptomyces sp. NBC_01276 TaxID=2903808 RepID=UPI00352C1229